MIGYIQPDTQSGLSFLSSPIIFLDVPLSVLADVHSLQLGHVPQVCTFQLLQPPVVLLVGEVNMLLLLQAVDFQGQGTANTPDTFSLLAVLRLQIILLKGWML